jgi:hypothetical protein
MGETWAGGGAVTGAAGDGDEAGIRGLGLPLTTESLGDSVAPDAQRFTAGCPAVQAAIPTGPGGILVVERKCRLQKECLEGDCMS